MIAQTEQDLLNDEKVIRSALSTRKVLKNGLLSVPRTKGAPDRLRKEILKRHTEELRSSTTSKARHIAAHHDRRLNARTGKARNGRGNAIHKILSVTEG